MIDLLLHFLHTISSDSVQSRILAVEGGLVITYLVWRGLVRRFTRILTTAAVLGVSTLLFSHPLHFGHIQPLGPTNSPILSNQP